MRLRWLLAAGILLALLGVRISGQDAPAAYTFSTLAGMPGAVVKSADGTGSGAQFDAPRGIAVDRAGNAFVVDANNNTIRRITREGVVTTLAGVAGERGRTDGEGAAARFSEPFGLATDVAGNLYVADNLNHAIRRVTPAGVVTTLAGAGMAGSADGTGVAARFHEPRGVAVDADGAVYVADYENDTIRKVTSSGVVTTFAGSPNVQGNADGSGAAARFRGPMGVAVDAAGTVYVADTGNRSIRKITSAGAVTTLRLSGSPLGEPRGIAVDSAGTIYVGDPRTHTVRSITPTGTVSTLAGQSSRPGVSDGTGSAAGFHYPSGVAVDTSGSVYVADTENDTVRVVARGGAVTTLAGSAGSIGSTDGTGAAARFAVPYGVGVDLAGNVYVVDHGNHTVRKVTPAGVVTTLAGTPGSMGSADGTGAAARFKFPGFPAADALGNVFVIDTDNQSVRQITPAGVVTTVGGGSVGSTDGVGTAARFFDPKGIAVDRDGRLFIVDRRNHTIRLGTR